jgi:hypothetical protein
MVEVVVGVASMRLTTPSRRSSIRAAAAVAALTAPGSRSSDAPAGATEKPTPSTASRSQ